MKICLVLLLLLANLNVFANEESSLPPRPENCFKDEDYCHTTRIYEADHNGEMKRFVQVNFFAYLSEGPETDAESIIKTFYDFDSWPSYVEGSPDVIFSKSVGEIIERDGKIFRRHNAEYKTVAPFPVNYVTVKEYAEYEDLTPIAGAVKSIRFFQLPGVKMEGLDYKDGELHLFADKERGGHNVLVIIRSIPKIKLLPNVTAKYTARSIVAIFSGMFDL